MNGCWLAGQGNINSINKYVTKMDKKLTPTMELLDLFAVDLNNTDILLDVAEPTLKSLSCGDVIFSTRKSLSGRTVPGRVRITLDDRETWW